MNKLNLFILGAVGLMLASCSQEEIYNNATSGDGTMHFRVSLPAKFETRSLAETRGLGDATTATRLDVYVYEYGENNTYNFSFTNGVNFNDDGSVDLNLALVNDRKYKIVFFAYNWYAGDVYKVNSETGELTVDYSQMTSYNNNNDFYDCFYTTYDAVNVPYTDLVTSVVLSRPVAQINWATSDIFDDTTVSDYGTVKTETGVVATKLQTTLTVKPFTSLNLLTGEMGAQSSEEVTLNAFAMPTGASLNVESLSYQIIAMQYLLAPVEPTDISMTLTIDNGWNNNKVTTTKTIDLPKAQIQANYQTNIFGPLLTQTAVAVD